MTLLCDRRPGASMGGLAAVAAALSLCAALSGCGSTPKDDYSSRSNETLYSEAKDDIESGSYDRAAKTLEKLEARAAGTLLAQQASLDLAYVYWKTGEKAQAVATLDRFIKLNPSSPALDYALYMRGVSNFNESLGFFGALANQDLSERDQKASREAWQAFRQLLDQFPQSRYVEDAKLRMDFLVNSLAAYEVHVARYYFRRGAYIAAANRAQSAVSEFQSAPATEEALFIMARSYEKLDLLELRDSADRVLRTNYPDSRFLPDGRRAPEAAWWHIW